jgi:hypothetical protein
MGRTSKDVRRHVLYVHEKTADFQCPSCDACFKDARALREHTAWAHSSGERSVCCEICSAKFPTNRALRSHCSTRHSGRVFKCTNEDCDLVYASKASLKIHVESVHLGTWFHECPECGVRSSTPYFAASHMATHGATFRYGKSRGESVVFQALTFAGVEFVPEVRMPGSQMRFDFWARWVSPSGQAENLLVEVDGIFHYRVYRPGAVGRMTLMGQVSRDLRKTRFALEAGFPLLRLEGALPSEPAELVGIIQTFLAHVKAGSLKPYAMHVHQKSWVSDVAQWITRGVAAQSMEPMPSDKELEEAMKLLASNLTTVDFTQEEVDELPIVFAEAVLALFIREHSLIDFAAEMRDCIHRACVSIARTMPEFQHETPGSAEEDVAPSSAGHLQHQLFMAAVQERVGHAGAARKFVPEMMPCWLCEGVSFSFSPKGEDALLLHLNRVHDKVALARCRYCPAILESFADIRGAAHAFECPLTSPSRKLQSGIRCGCGDCTHVFQHRTYFYRHMNDCHSAHFTDALCQRCSKCSFQKQKGSHVSYQSHVCSAPS